MKTLLKISFAASLLLPLQFASAASVSIVNVDPGTSVSPGQAVTFYAAASGFTDAKYSVTGAGTIDAYGDYTWTPGATDAGGHDVTITVTDSTGASASATIHLYVIPNVITIANLSPGTIAFTREPVTFSVQTPGFTSPTFYVRDSYGGTTITNSNLDTSGNFSWTPAGNEQGLHSILITANDPYGHTATAEQAITVMAPMVQITNFSATSSVLVGTPVTFSASTTGFATPTFAVTDALGWFATVVASDTNATNGAFSWTPTSKDIGTHTLTLKVTDADGNTGTAAVGVIVTGTPSDQTVVAPTTNVTTTSSGPSSSGTTKQDGYVFTTYLQIGSRGTAVTELQKHLAIDGFFTASPTGYFGVITAAAVKSFQAAHGIAQLGVVGPATRKALNAE